MPPKKETTKETTGGSVSESSLKAVVAGPDKDFYNWVNRLGQTRENADIILKTQTPKNSSYSYPWGLYEELLDLDPHLASVVDVRKVGVTSLPTLIQPADDSERAAMIARWVEWWLGEIGQGEYFVDGGFLRDRLDLLDAVPFGVSTLEVVWDDLAGFLVPHRLLHRPPRQFKFTWDNGLRLVSSAGDTTGVAVPERKFLVFTPYTRYENPYGIPALRRVYFYSVFKRTGYRFWSVFLDKFGSPTLVAKHPKSATDPELAKLYTIINAYQQETGVIIPEDFAIEMMEAKRSGGASYNDFIDSCNREVSKGILGQNLTTEVSGGSYAAANVHMLIRGDILENDARLEMAAWDRLIRWAVDLNFAEPKLYPHFIIRTDAAADTRTRLEVYRQMASLKYPLSRKQINEDLHLHAPLNDKDTFIAEGAVSAAGGQWGYPGTGEPGAQSANLNDTPKGEPK
jgi:phage gp29-like protein